MAVNDRRVVHHRHTQIHRHTQKYLDHFYPAQPLHRHTRTHTHAHSLPSLEIEQSGVSPGERRVLPKLRLMTTCTRASTHTRVQGKGQLIYFVPSWMILKFYIKSLKLLTSPYFGHSLWLRYHSQLIYTEV